MAEKLITHALRDALFQFAVKSRKLVSPMLRALGRASTGPVTVGDDELAALRSMLRRVHAALRDADSLSVTDHSVRLWLAELGDLEYRAEDVFEELEYECHRAAQLEDLKIDLLRAAALATGKRKREVAQLFAAAPAARLRRKIDDIWARYEEIASDRKKLRLRPGDGAARPAVGALVPSSSLPRCQIHGRERDLQRVVEMVCQSQPDGRRNYAVVAIVGMAGVGKTSLMQHVCGEEAVASRFDLALWVWVSQEFDVVGVTAKIVEAITRSRPDCSELSALHGTMVEHLTGKRCLLVLDDVWDDNPNHWDTITAQLSFCAPGSTVVVTTRSRMVAKMVTPNVYHLGCLSDEHCWLVCQRRASHGCTTATIDDELTNIGQQIAKKCRGVPLAAEAAGTAMSTSITRKHWTHVLNSNLWADNDEAKNHVLPALKPWSHQPLKRCFAFCSLFPKSFVFDKDALVQLWTAQGFIDAGGEQRPEDVGTGYFYDLVARCFFQPSPSHGIDQEKFVMHDLYQELAQFVSGNECRMIQHIVSGNECRTIQQSNLNRADKTSARHLSIVNNESHPEQELSLDSFCAQDLRTFLFLSRLEQIIHGEMPLRRKIAPYGLMTDFECLRVLDLSNTDIVEVPKSIGSLIHLRYLGLDNTRIQMLPESVGALFHLQTIKLNHCSSLTQLPHGSKLLQNLRCFEIAHSNVQMPSGIRALTSLQKLPVFVVGDGSAGCGIGELDELINIRGDLHIIGLSNLDAAQAANVNLWKKEGLQKLTLEWCDILQNSDVTLRDLQPNEANRVPDCRCVPQQNDRAAQVLQCLRPNSNLEELIIKGYNGSSFPSWVGSLPLDRLASIELKDCQNCEELPPLGCLPSLKHVVIQSLPSVQLVGPEFLGDVGDIPYNNRKKAYFAFPALESLKFRDMGAWEEWSGVKDEHFPELKYLSIVRCGKLKVLPNFTSGPKQRIRNCEKLLQPLCQNIHWNLMEYIPPSSELSYTCMAEENLISRIDMNFSWRIQDVN
uniref:NBS-LRR-like resistance protein n=1 Tax=Oryza sativa TaxID=4530 RepID=A0A0U2QMD7_ORYSA|nr:NBS-LRR-like resistance protein [Oryza sativa]